MSRQDDSAPYAQFQGFHPEFGYLCPSTALRRRAGQALKLGIAAIAVFAGAAFGLSSVLTTSPQPLAAREEPVLAQSAPRPGLAEQAMPMVPADAPVQSVPQPPAPARSAAPMVLPSGPAALAHAQASCADLSESFLAPQCRTVKKSRAARAAEAARRRAAGVALGQAEAAPEAVPEKAVRARAVPQKVAPEKAPPDAAPAPVDVKVDTAKAAGAPVKTARKRAPRDDAAVAEAPPPPAPAPQPAFGLFSFFHDLGRVANGPSTASWQ